MNDSSFMPLAQATEIAGSLGSPSKMPGKSYGIPAAACKVGSKLRGIAGTVCTKCYAFSGNYRFKGVKAAQEKRLAGITHPMWVEAMVSMIVASDCLHFRWHDSGDIQSLDHLERIADVAVRLPNVRFWIPTREQGFVRSFMRKHGPFPPNLMVRVSAQLIDGSPPSGFSHTSTVVTDGATCPSHLQDNACGHCRACWYDTKNISYRKH